MQQTLSPSSLPFTTHSSKCHRPKTSKIVRYQAAFCGICWADFAKLTLLVTVESEDHDGAGMGGASGSACMIWWPNIPVFRGLIVYSSRGEKGLPSQTKININSTLLVVELALPILLIIPTRYCVCFFQSTVPTASAVGFGLLSWGHQRNRSKWWREGHRSYLLVHRTNCSVVDSDTTGGTC